ncbi:hypothetical protein R1flu_011710 [Riccia fluitans]|uniref:Uncharacterized protein n=1 Tax=Riccia fluitans TaxID=41844 RepID=A0ABD1Z8S7_9MARC
MDTYAPYGPNEHYVSPPPVTYEYQYSATAPVIHAPVPQYGQSRYRPPNSVPNSRAWTTGLCGCFDDCNSCCMGFWCPCVLVGRSVEAIDQGRTSCPLGCSIFLLLQALLGCGCLYTCMYRTRLREKYDLPATPCPDLCVDCCCLSCSICQVYRELENRNALIPDYSYPAISPSAPEAPSDDLAGIWKKTSTRAS